MTSTPGSPPPGWYPDPAGSTGQRWWDGATWTDQVRATAAPTLTEQLPGEVGAAPAAYVGPPIMVSTMNDMPGFRVVDVYGEVFGLTVRARNAFSNIGASFRTVFGGEAKGYTKLLSDSRLEAVERMKYEANLRGANAILAMRFDTGEISDLMTEVAAYGTAVRVERIN